MTTTVERLVAELDAAGALPARWRAAVRAVSREQFVPARIWVDDPHGRPQPIDRAEHPGRWRDAVAADIPILTQFDDGATVWPGTDGWACTSSASKPELVLAMLDALDVHPGMRVLEIGTGTGYNTALLAHRLGAEHVVSVEIDPGLAAQARAALARAGYPAVRVIVGDGALGWEPAAPYDRVLSTAAVRVGQLPVDWITQSRPGAVILTPMRTDFGGGVALVRLVLGPDGTATGRPIRRLGFMALRAQRTPYWTTDDLDPHDPDARISTTTLKPWRVAATHDARWAIGTQVPDCVWDHQPPANQRTEHLLWLRDLAGGSWALARYDTGPGPRQVRQHGPRRLWDEVETAFRCWAAAGKPALEATTLAITVHTQQTTLDPATTAA
jgi:protein-L-isoaspartate O-methyltransferase